MLLNTQVTPKKAVIMLPPEAEKPMFSEEFVSMVQDHAYETLRAYLERTNQKSAIVLLDDLIILSHAAYRSEATWMQNQMISETIASASHHVLELGANWGE